MTRTPKQKLPTRVVKEWALSTSATLGSAVRAKGILLEVRAGLPFQERKLLGMESGTLVLQVPEDDTDDHSATADAVSRKLVGIEAMPVIPREVEDILSIKPAERYRWLKDGRLESAGTRTIKLRGRARKITFHVFDPRHIEDVQDRDLPEVWREQDAKTAAENRRRGAQKAALKRSGKLAQISTDNASLRRSDETVPALRGWDNFDLDGLLR
jgi:hypothetical protein